MASGILASLKCWALGLERDVVALWLAARDRRVPWYAKAVAAAVAAYALSPIDLIPDFVPVLGYVDDLIIVPLGTVMAVKLVPPGLMEEFRLEAGHRSKPASRAGLLLIVTLWLLMGLAVAWFWLGVPSEIE